MTEGFCVEAKLSDRSLKIETGVLARQADGSAIVTFGETMVLAAVVYGREPKEGGGGDFLPLTVDYRERVSAAGKFPGGFIKREGRPSTKEILTSRLIDRPIRPLFPDGFANELQILVTVISADQENDPDILAMNASSAALAISGVPFLGPIGSVRVGLIDGKFVVNPTTSQLLNSKMDIVVSGTKEGIIMTEAGIKEVPEDKVLEAMQFAQTYINQLVDAQLELKKKCGKPTITFEPQLIPEDLYKKIHKKYLEPMRKVFFTPKKKERTTALEAVLKQMLTDLCFKDKNGDPLPDSPKESHVTESFYRLETELVRSYAVEGRRADGRGLKDIRPISIKTGLLPRTHGSAVFTRGETQALVTVTLGTKMDEQIIDGLAEEYSKRYMFHYNFPPFSVGEIKPQRGPGRREIGHGDLAERAIEAVIPDGEEFPYTIRIISDILESNGSSSMASVCGGTLALLDAGVKIKAPVAGIAMGLIKEGGKFCILSDILGSEDKHGDMDFKVAGTENGITALQMDLKTPGISFDIMKQALEQARQGRLNILKLMNSACPSPKTDLSAYAPRLVRLTINPEKIGALIGPGGKTVRDIQAKTGATIEIDDSGFVIISSKDLSSLNSAKQMVEAITEELKVGRLYKAKVVSMRDFGAMIELVPGGQDGMIHISELAEGYVQRVDDVVKIGAEIDIKLITFDDMGRPRFSLKQALREKNNAKV